MNNVLRVFVVQYRWVKDGVPQFTVDGVYASAELAEKRQEKLAKFFGDEVWYDIHFVDFE